MSLLTIIDTYRNNIKVFFIISSFGLLYSCSTPNNTIYKLEIEIEKSNISHALLYGFLGDNQIFVDTLFVENNKISYPLSHTCNPGVYRIVFDASDSFDFIYNNEHVIFRLNPAHIRESFQIISSEENKLLYTFFFALQDVHNDYEACKSDSNLKMTDVTKKYMATFSSLLQNKDTLSFSHTVIRALFILDYMQHIDAHPDSKLNECEFFTQEYFRYTDFSDERILATPYFYLVLQNYLELLQKCGKDFVLEGLSLLHQQTNMNQDINFFTHSFIYEYLLSIQDTSLIHTYLESTYSGAYFFNTSFSNIIPSNQFLGYGTQIDTIPGISFHKAQYTILLFSDTLSATHTNMLTSVSIHERGLQNNSIQVHIITPQSTDSFGILQNNFSLIIAPTIVVVDENGVIRTRTYGEEMCTELIELLRK